VYGTKRERWEGWGVPVGLFVGREGKKRKGKRPPLLPLVSFIMVGGRGFAGWWYVTGLSAVLYHMSGLSMDV